MVITHTSAHKSRNLTVLHDITCTTHVETKEGGSQVGHGAGFCAVMLSPPPPSTAEASGECGALLMIGGGEVKQHGPGRPAR